MEKNIKFMVTKNIGECSEETFGKVGTIYDTKNLGVFYDKQNVKWGKSIKTFELFQKCLKEKDKYQTNFVLLSIKDNKNMKQFAKSDLKVGYLVRLASGILCRLEQLGDGHIGLITQNNSWVVTLYNEESDNYDENLKDKEDNDYNINEVYGYSSSGCRLYDVSTRDLLWRRKGDINFKKYEIECDGTGKITIEPIFVSGYKAKTEYPIGLISSNNCNYDNNFYAALSISNAKELIKSLQEIVDYVEEEHE